MSLSRVTTASHYSDSKESIFASPKNNVQALMRNSRPPIPIAYAGIDDFSSLFQADDDNTRKVPFFWHIPRSGGTTIISLMGKCHGLHVASTSSPFDHSPESLPDYDHYQEIFMSKTDSLYLTRYDEVKYFNVNLNSTIGLERAMRLNLVGQLDPLVHVISSPLIHETADTLFSLAHTKEKSFKGVMAAFIRHPIEREISQFSILKQQKAEFANYELLDWIHSESFIDNIMVRSIVNKNDPSDEINLKDVLVAKEVLRRKCLIGLLEEKEESWRRLKQYFGQDWDAIGANERMGNEYECEENMLNWEWNPQIYHPFVKQQDDNASRNLNFVYERLITMNAWDMQLYEYAKFLFWEQGQQFSNTYSNGATVST
jgi:hypothetical protein